MHPNCVAVDAALAAAGVPGRVRMLPEPAPTAAAAAAQLGCPVGAIANSLVFDLDGEPLLILTSGAHRVDVARVQAHLGSGRLRRADADFVRRHTGQPIGGVAPVGHPQPLRTVVDTALAAYAPLWAAGGIPHAVVELSYADLVRLTGGEELAVAG